MDEQLRSLVSALPTFPDRMDDVFQQVSDLVEIAQKLGMTGAANYLTTDLNYFRKWHGPKPMHPEQRSGEVHLLNSEPETVRYIGWKTKRAGDVAIDVDGNPVPGQVPVFVEAEELARAGQLTERDTVGR
jgi:LmbE family N-acetylglucosaminyl deacetylase